MLNKLLEEAKKEIKEEIERIGFINDSDNSERFLECLAKELTEKELVQDKDDIELYYEKQDEIEETEKELFEKITEYMQETYENEGFINKECDYIGCFYKDLKGLKLWEDCVLKDQR